MDLKHAQLANIPAIGLPRFGISIAPSHVDRHQSIGFYPEKTIRFVRPTQHGLNGLLVTFMR